MALLCRALFDLSVNHTGALPVREGEKFLVLTEASADNPHWWYAVNALGDMGYVPKNYVNIEEVTSESLLRELDDLIELLHSNDNPTPKHRNLLKNLSKVRSDLAKGTSPTDRSKITSPVDPPTNNEPVVPVTLNHIDCSPGCVNSIDKSNDLNTTSISTDSTPVHLKNVPEEVSLPVQALITDHSEASSKSTSDNNDDSNCIDSVSSIIECVSRPVCKEIGVQTVEMEITIPPLVVPELVDQVRTQTRLNYPLSILAVVTTMETLGTHLPSISTLCDTVVKELANLKLAGSCSQVFKSRDRERLLSIFHGLWSCKEDEQQRSWPLQEDEGLILGHLNHLKQLLVDADSRVCCEVIQLDNYECAHTLVTYYQMEPRRRLRLAALGALELMCCLDVKVVDHLLSSVLPTELVMDILNHPNDVERFMVTARMLSCVFCTGQPPPRSIYAHLNVTFVNLLLEQLESLLEGSVEEEVANLDLSIILSLNLHLQNPEDNFILEALRKRNGASAFTEKLMLLINREEDPVRIPTTNDLADVPNSVLKLMLDVFSDPACAQHFYVNDIKVLLDIIVRQLTDLPSGTKRRLDYLRLARSILTNTSYCEHKHQREGLEFSLESILEHEDSPQREKDFAQAFFSEFPHLFAFA